jgi:putative ABC transport system permease protein
MTTLVPGDFEAMERELPTVMATSPSAVTSAQVVFGNHNWNTRVEGYNEKFPILRNWELTQGSFFEEKHVKAASRVAVLGQTVVEELFGGADPVGQMIRIKNLPFQVLGVLEPKGTDSRGTDQDDTVIVPYTTVQKKFQSGVLNVQSGLVAAVSDLATQAAETQITGLLRQRHGLGPGQEDDFFIRNLAEMAEAAVETSRILTTLLASIAAVSLIVGGIGIMNIMLVSVSERTREIGIHMSIGARPNHVRLQFLSEAVALCLSGGLLGLILGVGGSIAVSQFFGWPVLISSDAVIFSFLFSASIGISFGYYPAHKAAALDPIEALRYE